MEYIICLLITVTSWSTFRNSMKIRVVKVIDIIMTKLSLNKQTARNIMIDDW